jgi:hypothetical protein
MLLDGLLNLFPLVAISEAIWLQLIALGNKFVDQLIPGLTLISVIVGVVFSARNRSAITQVQSAIQTKTEEIKDAGRMHAENAANASAAAASAAVVTAASAAAEAVASREAATRDADRTNADLMSRINSLESINMDAREARESREGREARQPREGRS